MRPAPAVSFDRALQQDGNGPRSLKRHADRLLANLPIHVLGNENSGRVTRFFRGSINEHFNANMAGATHFDSLTNQLHRCHIAWLT